MRFDLTQPRLPTHVVVGGNANMDVGQRAIGLGVALDHSHTERVRALRQVDAIAGALHRLQGVEHRLEHRQIRRSARIAGVGREIEDNHGDLALGPLGPTQRHPFSDPCGQRRSTLNTGEHVLLAVTLVEAALAVTSGAVTARRSGASTEHHRHGGAVEFRDRHHDGALDRQQAPLGTTPVHQILELDRVSGDVGDIQLRQDLGGGLGVVVGGAAHQREPGQRDHGVDPGHAIANEELVNRLTGVESRGKHRQHIEPLGLECGQNAVVVLGVAGQEIRPQHQNAHGASSLRGSRQQGLVVADAALDARVVDADLGVIHWGLGFDTAAPHTTRAVGVAIHQRPHEVEHIVFGATQPILQSQEIGARILCRARNETQNLRQATQHLHLLGAALGRVATVATELLEQSHGRAGRAAHVELADAGELDHLGGGHDADHGVALVPLGLQQG